MHRHLCSAVLCCLLLLPAADGRPAATVRLEELDLGGDERRVGQAAEESVDHGEAAEHRRAEVRARRRHARRQRVLDRAGRPGPDASRPRWVVDDNASDRAGLDRVRDLRRRSPAVAQRRLQGGREAAHCRVDLDRRPAIWSWSSTDAGDGQGWDHGDWAEAVFEFAGGPPRPADPGCAAGGSGAAHSAAAAEPRIHGPQVYGVRPAAPFLYRIPATGQRPIDVRRGRAARRPDARPGPPASSRAAWPRPARTARRCTARNARGEGAARVPHRGRPATRPHAADGLEQLVHPLPPRQRQGHAPGGGPDGRLRHGRLRLPVRQHRRLLDGEGQLARRGDRRPDPRRPTGGCCPTSGSPTCGR